MPDVEENLSVEQRLEPPKPVAIILTDEVNSFILDDKALSAILLRPDVAERSVAIISIAGAFRKGKSFLLNFFLRFLQTQDENVRHGLREWLSDDDSNTLDGFSWRRGCERETSGILLWSEPFLATMPTGEKVAILLMDTQGALDILSTVKDKMIFAFSTMISSVQVNKKTFKDGYVTVTNYLTNILKIYNLSHIQIDDLQHLKLFTDYGRLVLEESPRVKPFQTLIFLVRDWSYPYEADYGFSGGKQILERLLQISDKQNPELQQLLKYIKSCFTDIKCFLLPHPGLKVTTSPFFNGQLSDIENEFKLQLKALIPNVLSVDNLVLKEINCHKVTCRELLEYFRVYAKILQGEELPEPKSLLLATAEGNNLAAVANAKALYWKNMQELCGVETPCDDFDQKHSKCRDEALNLFKQTCKMGGDELHNSFFDKLEKDLEDLSKKFQEPSQLAYAPSSTPTLQNIGPVSIWGRIAAFLLNNKLMCMFNFITVPLGVGLLRNYFPDFARRNFALFLAGVPLYCVFNFGTIIFVKRQFFKEKVVKNYSN